MELKLNSKLSDFFKNLNHETVDNRQKQLRISCHIFDENRRCGRLILDTTHLGHLEQYAFCQIHGRSIPAGCLQAVKINNALLWRYETNVLSL